MGNSCVQLKRHCRRDAFANQIQQVTTGFSAPLTLDVSSLTSLNSLSSLALSMSVRPGAVPGCKSISG
jgi:hypothetical protein